MIDSAKILFLAASPAATAKLELDRENRAIKEKIRASRYAEKIVIESEWAVRDDDLLRHMNVHHPNIVHFSGHGTATGELIFEGENRSIKPISSRAMKSLFANFKKYTHLVVLNACDTHTQAKAIAEDIDCVIGTNQAIGDETAISFISAFYEALGFGKSVHEAFQQGITQMMIKNLPEEQTPQLFTRPGIDASRITLTELAQISQPQVAPQITPEDKSAMSPRATDRQISIFISCAPKDEDFRIDLEKQLVVMKRNKEIIVRHMGNALGGDSIARKRQEYIGAADIILLLVSPDFMSSEDLYDNELRPALIRSEQKLSVVIPIIIRDTASWEEDQLFGKLLPLPREKKPVSAWTNRDSAITSIVKDISNIVNGLKKSK